MMTPEILQCYDRHFQHIIYSLGPYIADYPEQALLTCIVQGWSTLPSPMHSERIRVDSEWNLRGMVGMVGIWSE